MRGPNRPSRHLVLALALFAAGCATQGEDDQGEDVLEENEELAAERTPWWRRDGGWRFRWPTRRDAGVRDAGTLPVRDAGPSTEPEEDAGEQPNENPGEIPGGQAFAPCEGSAESPAPRLLRLLTRREFQNTLADLLFFQPRDVDVSSFPLEPRVRGYDNNANASVITSRHVDEVSKVTEKLVARAVTEKKAQLVPCQAGAQGCARTFVERFGLRAFRRPLTGEETARYEALFAQELTGGSFDEGVKLAITSMLLSPNFLYRSEVGNAQSSGTFKLTAYETASALSYLYWGTMPDQALFDAASRNELATPAQLEAQARRLLQSPRAADQLAEFSLQWLGSDSLLSAFKDKGVYPAFSDAVRTAMVEEQRRFVTDVALTRDGKFGELFTANYVFANAELARFYGLSAPSNDFSKVAITPQSDRGGLLGLGAVMAAQAHSMESSPIKRGVFVRSRLLCQDLPPPPPSLDTTPPGLDPKLTTRARFAKHTANATCSGCHQFIDGVGFGLEGFDGVGQKRVTENGLPVDNSGEIKGLESLGGDDKTAFVGQRELSQMIATSPNAQSCLTLQFYRFARGYQETSQDSCSLEKLHQRFRGKDLTLKELLVNVALLDSFTVRRAQ